MKHTEVLPRLAVEFPALKRLGEALRPKEIPVVHQVTATDCGAASLAMTLGFQGRTVPLEELRENMATGRDGVTARAILETAALYDLRARGVRLEVEDLVHLPRASILHWSFSHFVVFDGVDKGGIRLVDPAMGRRVVPPEEARRSFTGVALVFERTEQFVPAKPGESRVYRHLKKAFAGSNDWHRIALVSILLELFSLLLPMINGALVDRVLPKNDDHLLWVLLAAMGATVVFHFGASVTRSQLLLQLKTGFDAKMTFGFIEHLLRLPYGFFERRHSADLQMRVGSIGNIREVLTGALLSASIDGVLVISHLVLLSFTNLMMTAIALIIVAVQVAVYLATRKKMRELATGSVLKQAEAANALNELLAGMESLKASGCEQKASQTWAGRYVDVMNVGLNQGSLSTFSQSLLASLQLMGPMVLMIAGVTEVMNHRLSLGVMMTAHSLGVGFLQPMMNLVGSFQQLQTTRVHLARIDDILETEPEQEQANKLLKAPTLEGAVKLDAVSFRYGAKLAVAVKDVTVEIKPGECVAIVGRSGSGKTTLGRLLLGLYEPTEGTVLLDGMPLRQLELRSVRRQLGVVTQKPHIFGSTIRRNIALADPEIPLSQIREAARRACIDTDIAAMPMQYDTVVVANGASLSGGQRQRIALARALIENPAILLLDEATSALDSITEAAVQAELDALECTRIYIAHRLSTVVGADRILVMEAGALVEQGTHTELLAKDGFYARLIAAQLEELADGGNRRPKGALAEPPDEITARMVPRHITPPRTETVRHVDWFPADAPRDTSTQRLGSPRAALAGGSVNDTQRIAGLKALFPGIAANSPVVSRKDSRDDVISRTTQPLMNLRANALGGISTATAHRIISVCDAPSEAVSDVTQRFERVHVDLVEAEKALFEDARGAMDHAAGAGGVAAVRDDWAEHPTVPRAFGDVRCQVDRSEGEGS